MENLIRAAIVALDRVGAAERVLALAGRITTSAVCAVLAGACAAAALGCAIAALWIYLIPLVGPVGAPLVVAATFTVLCLALLLAARVVVRRRPPPRDLSEDARLV